MELDGLEKGTRLGDSDGDPVGELDGLEDGVRLGDSVGGTVGDMGGKVYKAAKALSVE